MNSDVRRIKTRNLQTRVDAVGGAINDFEPVAPAAFSVHDWSNSIELAYEEQWGAAERHADGGWPWAKMRDTHRRSMDSQMFAIKSGDRLAALALVTVHDTFVKLDFLEGDPRPDCPLKGFRAALALDIAARYGQGMCKRELRLEPVNSAVRDLYVEGYGFEEVTPQKGEPYLKRDLGS